MRPGTEILEQERQAAPLLRELFQQVYGLLRPCAGIQQGKLLALLLQLLPCLHIHTPSRFASFATPADTELRYMQAEKWA